MGGKGYWGRVYLYIIWVLFVQHTMSCYDTSLSCFAFEFCFVLFFYTTCRGTEVAMSFSRVENVDSVSVPKCKKKKTKIVTFL